MTARVYTLADYRKPTRLEDALRNYTAATDRPVRDMETLLADMCNASTFQETLRESMRAEAPAVSKAFPRVEEQEPYSPSGPDSRGAAGASYCADCGAWLDPRKFVAYCSRARIGFCVRCAPGRVT